MDSTRKEQLINEVLSEYIPHTINGERLLFGRPTYLQKVVAADVYQEWYFKGLQAGLMDNEESLDLSYRKGVWDDNLEYILTDLEKDIRKLKVGLVGCIFRSSERLQIKTNLNKAKNKYSNLLERKHAYRSLTAEYLGTLSKQIYLSLCEIYKEDGTYFIRPEDIPHSSNLSIDKVLSLRSEDRWAEEVGRELARSDPWRGLWVTHKEQRFPFKNESLDDNQEFLLTWSKVYDNINESMDCPADAVIEDDDALDGWFILQKKNRDKDRNQREADELTSNPKIGGADEIFIKAQTKDDIEQVYGLNDPVSRGKARSNLTTAQALGRVKEADLPQTKMKLRMQQQQDYINKVKGN
jgi:hypothetical protein